MPRKRAGRATWFKVHLHHKPLIDSVPDEIAGAALKAALQYFQDGENPNLPPLTKAVFSVLRASSDEATGEYVRAVENGSKGGRPPVTQGNQGLPTPTDKEVDKEVDKDIDKDIDKDSSGSIEKFIPPTVDEVRTYCNENNFSFSPEKFFDYYQSKGWKFGKEPIVDWKAVARNWERNENETRTKNGNGQIRSESVWTGSIGTVV